MSLTKENLQLFLEEHAKISANVILRLDAMIIMLTEKFPGLDWDKYLEAASLNAVSGYSELPPEELGKLH